jgi:ABC-type Fe3+ transport system substrate-binding protein
MIRTEFGRAFARWTASEHGYKGVIEWRDAGGTMNAIRYVRDRFEQMPDGIGIDVFFGGGVDPFMEFAPAGLLQRCDVPEEVLAAIPQTYAGLEVYDADQRWFGACLSSFGVLFNRPVLDFMGVEEPTTWADLGRPDYFTFVASADPRQSGSMHMVYEIILQAYGWEKGWETVMRIGANCRGFTSQANDVPRDVSAGEAFAGMAIDLYALQAIGEAGEDRLGFRLPESLTVVNADGIGILKGAPNLDVAQQFVEFVLSEHGQKLWILRPGVPGGPTAEPLYRLPLIPGFAKRFGEDAAVSFDPFEFEGGVQFDPAKKNARWRILNDLLGACVIDVHDDLAATWKALRHLPADDPRLREFLDAPVSEEELLRLASDKWRDPAFQADTVAQWASEATSRYRRLRETGRWSE